MILKLTFTMGNEAFDDGAKGTFEAARILRGVSKRVENGEESGNLRDINGNKVGSFSIEGE